MYFSPLTSPLLSSRCTQQDFDRSRIDSHLSSNLIYCRFLVLAGLLLCVVPPLLSALKHLNPPKLIGCVAPPLYRLFSLFSFVSHFGDVFFASLSERRYLTLKISQVQCFTPKCKHMKTLPLPILTHFASVFYVSPLLSSASVG